ncbi:MAG: hypothetical protein M1812_005092 [Candelaria pacifica]|nr:MAG: hypothetical protein M1812_005092 [Candelaria pacifica]
MNQEWQDLVKDVTKLKSTVESVWRHSTKEFGSMHVQLVKINENLGLAPVEEEEHDVSKLAAGQGIHKRKKRKRNVVDSDSESQYEDAGEHPSTEDEE